MIRNDNEYGRALERIEEEKARFAAEELKLLEQFSADEVERLMEPLLAFHAQLVDDVHVYERLKRGDLGDLTNLRGAGRMLVHLRIAEGLTQRELAERLGVNESQVSRDERNEYHGVTLDRASKIMDAIGAVVRTKVVAAGTERQRKWAPPVEKAKDVATPSIPGKHKGEPLKPSVEVRNADIPFAA